MVLIKINQAEQPVALNTCQSIRKQLLPSTTSTTYTTSTPIGA